MSNGHKSLLLFYGHINPPKKYVNCYNCNYQQQNVYSIVKYAVLYQDNHSWDGDQESFWSPKIEFGNIILGTFLIAPIFIYIILDLWLGGLSPPGKTLYNNKNKL